MAEPTPYDPLSVERRWQERWAAEGTFRVQADDTRPKRYVLAMFPYPRPEGLPLGAAFNYVITDAVARFERGRGFNVLHPAGWDAFGLLVEEGARARGLAPEEAVRRDIEAGRRTRARLGLSVDPEREIVTSHPEYVRWTQWIFQALLNRGLAYRDEVVVPWCPALGTALAEEEVADGRSEYGRFPVERRRMRTWLLRITAYADRLLHDLDELAWPPTVAGMQRAWIGRRDGAEVRFRIRGGGDFAVFTPHPELLFGVTFCILSPEHPLAARLAPDARGQGHFTGAFATNPANGEEVPIWIAEDLRTGWGGLAAMGVPGHDARDAAFARRHGLPVRRVLHDGVLRHSSFLDGLAVEEARPRIVAWLADEGWGRPAVRYRLRDWQVSRQRAWGEPIPVREKAGGGFESVPDAELPLLPPAAGEGPPATGTLSQWLGSSWYALRFADPRGEKALVAPQRERYWLPVDLYVGGGAHEVVHLLYARFVHKVLFDLGIVRTREPFRRLLLRGAIRAAGEARVDDLIDRHGADVLRLALLAPRPPDADRVWREADLEAGRAFLDRAWRLLAGGPAAGTALTEQPAGGDDARRLHRTVAAVTRDLDALALDRAWRRLEDLLAAMEDRDGRPLPREMAAAFLRMLEPFAPHAAEEIHASLGGTPTLARTRWPVFDDAYL